MNHRSRDANRGEAPEPDRLTALTKFGPLATKGIGSDPRTGRPVITAGYGDAAHFRVGHLPAGSMGELHGALDRLTRRPCSFVIPGEPLPGIDLARCRRLLHSCREDDGSITPATFREAARRWTAVDFDSVPAPPELSRVDHPARTARFLASLLPPEFAGVSCVIQATAGAGIKPGIRARLWFLLDPAVSGVALTRLLRDAPVDRSLCRAVQPCYTAAPLCQGVADPMPWRVRLAPGARERVVVPVLPEPAKPRSPLAQSAPRGGSRYALAALERECAAIAAGLGDRHAALNRGPLALARFIRSGELAAVENVADLIGAARRAGIEDGDAELRRFLHGGLHAGLDLAGRDHGP